MPEWSDVVEIGTRYPGVEEGCHPYVLVRLERVDRGELAELLEEAWRLRAPKRVVAAFDEPA